MKPESGSFIIEELTDLVEEAVLQEFERIAERGGVRRDGNRLSAQQNSRRIAALRTPQTRRHAAYHRRQHLPQSKGGETVQKIEWRSTEEEKQSQLQRLADFQQRHADVAPQALAALQQAAINNETCLRS